MSLREALANHLSDDFTEVDVARLSHLGTHRKGKVRDLFLSEDEILMVTTDRLSAFDVVLTSVPCKGAILNAIALNAFENTKDICPNHILDSPHPNVMRVRRAEPVAQSHGVCDKRLGIWFILLVESEPYCDPVPKRHIEGGWVGG